MILLLYVVCGYPASGKSTFCQKQLRNVPGGIVFDMDAMRATLTAAAPHEYRMPQSVGRMLNDVAHWMEKEFSFYGIQDMFLIRMCPTEEEMSGYIMRQDVNVLLMDTPKDVCLERAKQRGDFDLARFGRACGRVDKFAAKYDDCVTKVSPPVTPLDLH